MTPLKFEDVTVLQRSPDSKRASAKGGVAKAERDIVALGIATAALILFVGTAGSAMPKIMRSWEGVGAAPDLLLTNAVLLNIALLIFGWRRYKDLQVEVAERRAAEAGARELAERDALTGCLNRRSAPIAIEALRQEVAGSGRDLLVLVIDVDGFKQVNDLHGHRAGDSLLQTLAGRMAQALPTQALLARTGGDEFVCAVPFDGVERADAELVVTRLMHDVSAPVPFGGLSLSVTISVGIAQWNASQLTPASDAETLINRADIAMYQAKKQGRNRAIWFEQQTENDLKFRGELEAGIRQGLSNGEFRPYYEQQVVLATGQLAGFEMLARWQSPRFGLVSPEVFVPIAEEAGLIGQLSEELLCQAMIDALEWHPDLTLSVNISPVQLRDPWFAHRITKMLVETGFPAKRLEIEITESSLHHNIDQVRAILRSLKNQGICISLDDFGTGYSSIAQLRSLQFDRLKIDRSFIAELAQDENGKDLVAAIVSVGKGLGLPVTAEGIADENVLAMLKEMGELKGQGYLYGEPEDAAETRERLRTLNLLRPDLQTTVPEHSQLEEERLAG